MGARLIRDLNPAGSSSPESMISIDGFLYFTANLGPSSLSESPPTDEDSEESGDTNNEDNTNPPDQDSLGQGIALVKSDGTSEGTKVLKEYNAINDLVESNGELYFIADDGTGNRLWRSDGTDRGTTLVKDLYPGADPNFPQNLFAIDGVLFYSAIDGAGEDGKYPNVNGYEVWRKEGNEVGSRFFRNLIPDKIITDTEITSEESETTVLDGNGNPVELTKTTTVATTIGPNGITTVTTTIEDESYINGRVVTQTTTKTEQAATTATDVAGTNVEEEKKFATETISTGTANITTSIFENDSFPGNFTTINGNYFFTAQSSSFYSLETRTDNVLVGGLELWFSDGTESGTRPININQNDYTFYEPEDGAYTPVEQTTNPDFGFKTQSSSSFPRELTKFGNQLVLVANDGISGFELWAISAEGTNLRQISNLADGNTSSSPKELTVVGDRLYFTADAGSGRKLWSTSRQLETPVLVNGAGEDPKHLTAIAGKLYFSATSELGRELWVADGTNSSLVADINPGSGSSSPKQLTTLSQFREGTTANQLFFTADGGQRGTELWSLDLNSANASPQRYADIVDGPSSSDPRQLINAEQRLFFTADDGQQGRELWTLSVTIQGPDGITDGGSTTILAQENDNQVFQFSSNQAVSWSLNGGDDEQHFSIRNSGLLSFNQSPDFEKPIDLDQNNIYDVRIRATDQNIGSSTDLEVSVRVVDINETENAMEAILVKNIRSGPASSNPTSLTGFKSNLLFAANNGKKGTELWISGGDKSSTSLLKDINKGSEDSNPSDLSPYQSDVYFTANDGLHGAELWITDGSQQGTTLLADINPGAANASPSDLTWIQKNLYFAASDGQHGRELWSYSPKTNNARMVVDLQTSGSSGSNPGEITELNGQIVFAANDAIYGRELWISDGSASGTRLLRDINPGGFSSNPSDLTAWNGNIVLTAESYLFGNQLLKLTSNALDLIDITGSSDSNTANQPEQLHASGDLLFYSAETTSAPAGDTGDNSEGTDPGGIEEESETLGRELWISNGKVGGSSLLMDINPGSASSDPSSFSTIGGRTYFSANDGVHGSELWVSDGTTTGTSLVVDIAPGPKGSSPQWITESNGEIYFSARHDDVGRELWRLDDNEQSATRIISAGRGTVKLKALGGRADEFRFELDGQFGKRQADRITGFDASEGDQLALDADVFDNLSDIDLVTVTSKKQLKTQRDNNTKLIYFEPKGKLYFNRNGTEPGYGEDGGLFAILRGGPDLSESAFRIV